MTMKKRTMKRTMKERKMAEFFRTVIEQAFAPAAVVAAVVFLLQKYFTRTLDRDLERYKKELEADLMITKARLEADLQTKLFEHQTRFSLYHQHKAEVIQELYAKITDYQIEVNGIVVMADDERVFTERRDELRQKMEKLSQAHTDLQQFFAKQSIYFDEQLRDQIEKAILDLNAMVYPFQDVANGEERIFAPLWPDQSVQGLPHQLANAGYHVVKTMWDIREKLENEFRRTLSG